MMPCEELCRGSTTGWFVTGLGTPDGLQVAQQLCSKVFPPHVTMPKEVYNEGSGLDFQAGLLSVLRKGIISDMPWSDVSITRHSTGAMASRTEVLRGLASLEMSNGLAETCEVAGVPPKFRGSLRPTENVGTELSAELTKLVPTGVSIVESMVRATYNPSVQDPIRLVSWVILSFAPGVPVNETLRPTLGLSLLARAHENLKQVFPAPEWDVTVQFGN